MGQGKYRIAVAIVRGRKISHSFQLLIKFFILLSIPHSIVLSRTRVNVYLLATAVRARYRYTYLFLYINIIIAARYPLRLAQLTLNQFLSKCGAKGMKRDCVMHTSIHDCVCVYK